MGLPTNTSTPTSVACSRPGGGSYPSVRWRHWRESPSPRLRKSAESFTVEAIDQASRVVTLKNKAGLSADADCGLDVQRFDALEVGEHCHVPFRNESPAMRIRPLVLRRRRRKGRR